MHAWNTFHFSSPLWYITFSTLRDFFSEVVLKFLLLNLTDCFSFFLPFNTITAQGHQHAMHDVYTFHSTNDEMRGGGRRIEKLYLCNNEQATVSSETRLRLSLRCNFSIHNCTIAPTTFTTALTLHSHSQHDNYSREYFSQRRWSFTHHKKEGSSLSGSSILRLA